MTGVLLAGSGGHARVVADILEQCGVEIAGYVGPGDVHALELERLGGDEDLESLLRRGYRRIHIALGDNRIRKKVTCRVREFGFELVSAISPRSNVSLRARLGLGVAVMPGATINAAALIGDGAIVNTGCSIDHDCEIGSFAHVAPGCHLAGNVAVGEGAFLGTGCSVIPRIEIGAWTVVGAGAAVVQNLPPGVTAVGVPARVIK